MAHQLLHDLILVLAIFGLVAGAAIILFWIAGSVERVWRQMRRPSRLEYEQYRAEDAIRAIKRRAVHEMLTAAREHPDFSSSGDIIESTAVEVRRGE
jgi:hypothetical protein